MSLLSSRAHTPHHSDEPPLLQGRCVPRNWPDAIGLRSQFGMGVSFKAMWSAHSWTGGRGSTDIWARVIWHSNDLLSVTPALLSNFFLCDPGKVIYLLWSSVLSSIKQWPRKKTCLISSCNKSAKEPEACSTEPSSTKCPINGAFYLFSACKIHSTVESVSKQLASSKPAQALTIRCTVCPWKTSGLLSIGHLGFRQIK